mmetsp:Transcript_1785/g.4883  ORF Transcript_1785/g.4883 Transcript_1785/m.4883 type:complete len:319 (+) Transcript_1785:915-1871(+)
MAVSHPIAVGHVVNHVGLQLAAGVTSLLIDDDVVTLVRQRLLAVAAFALDRLLRSQDSGYLRPVGLLLLLLLGGITRRWRADGDALRFRPRKAHVVLELEGVESLLEARGHVLPVQYQGENLVLQLLATASGVVARHEADQGLREAGRAVQIPLKVRPAVLDARVSERQSEAGDVGVPVVQAVGQCARHALLHLCVAPVHEVHHLHIESPVRSHEQVIRRPVDHLPDVSVLIGLQVTPTFRHNVCVTYGLVPEIRAQAFHLGSPLRQVLARRSSFLLPPWLGSLTPPSPPPEKSTAFSTFSAILLLPRPVVVVVQFFE